MIRALAILCAVSAAAAAEPAAQLDATGAYSPDIEGLAFQLGARQQVGSFVGGVEWGRWDPGDGDANRVALLAGWGTMFGDGATRGLSRCSLGPEVVFMTQTSTVFSPALGNPEVTRSGHTYGVEGECAAGIAWRADRLELGLLAQLVLRIDDGNIDGGDGPPPYFPGGSMAVGIGVVVRLYE